MTHEHRIDETCDVPRDLSDHQAALQQDRPQPVAGARADPHEAHVAAGDAAMLLDLLGAGSDIHPDDLAAAVAHHATLIGGADATVYLVDYHQRLLVPLPAGSTSPMLDIDRTLAGRVYRTCQPHRAEHEGPDGGFRLWVPIVEGSERLGVLGVTLSADGLRSHEAGVTRLGTLVGQLVTSRAAYGDTLDTARRLHAMDLAAEMRWSTLPPLTFTSSRVEIAGILEPAYQIAGDTFDYAVNGDHAQLALVDAMGHGLEASAMANLAVAAYRHARRDGLDLTATFKYMDAAFAEWYGDGQFATVQLVDLDLATGELRIVSGGHPRPLLLRGSHIVGEIECEINPPIGLGYIPTATLAVSLEPGDRVVFYTDGVVEARSAEGEEFGLTRFADMLSRAAAAELLPAEMLRRLAHAVLDHEAAERLRDDATIVLLGWPARLTAK